MNEGQLCRRAFGYLAVFCLHAVASAGEDELPNPFPRERVIGPELHRWDFAEGTDGWHAQHHCSIAAGNGVLTIRSNGADPYLSAGVRVPGGDLLVRIRMKLNAAGPGQIFWTSTRHHGTSEPHSERFRVVHDGHWHEYEVPMHIEGDLTAIRLDPGTAPGEVEVDWIAIHHGGLHPLEVVAIEQKDASLGVRLRNHGDRVINGRLNGSPHTFQLDDETVTVGVSGTGALEAARVLVQPDALPPIDRTVWVYRPGASVDSITRSTLDLTIEVSLDGSVVRLHRNGKPVAALAPLVHVDHKLPDLKLADEEWPLEFTGDGMKVVLSVTPEGTLRVRIDSVRSVEGPVVRVFGPLEQGLFAGLEYLGKGEHSSSKLDIETLEHLRVEPDPMKLTMPLTAVVTGEVSVALSWDDVTLRPVFAAPDFVDGAPGHRMALKGRTIEAVLRIGSGWKEGGRLEDVILWAVNRRGLPPLPKTPRSFDQQMQLSLAAYRGLVHDPDNGGWFHAVVPGSRRMPQRGAYLADCVSAIWRITGRVPDVPKLQLGGAHVRNPASFFVSGRAAEWLQIANRGADHLRRARRPDGSYRYDGKYRRGHFENTASGICARPAYQLLEHAYYTGDRQSLAAGLKTLSYLKRFRTPRGAQTWEVPLHTPDILASAHAVWAYVRAYEITGDREHLTEARRWAITGLPFVYQWSNQPIMAYATTPVYGATHWRAPNWIGLPVQWCGTVYAYSLLLLADYDQTLDWRQLAEGITICAEQMQYPDGPSVGCLPDVFDLPSQTRRPADINPGALVSLRLRLAGRTDSLEMAATGAHCVVAPFPVEIQNGKAQIQATPGVKYQVLIDGARVVDVASKGRDEITLAE